MQPAYKKLPSRKHFLHKLSYNFMITGIVLIFSLAVGILGYHHFYKIGWTDALLNASMILTGMGPIDKAETEAAKIFASFYALYSGIAFLSSTAYLFIPVLHRILHKLHLDIVEH